MNYLPQAMIRKRNHVGGSGMAYAFPKDHDDLKRQLGKYHVWVEKRLDQKRWTNYKGVKFGTVPNAYKTKYPF